MRCPRVENVLPVPDVMPLLPLSDVPVGIRNSMTVVLAMYPQGKDLGVMLSRNRTADVETHLPRLWNDPTHGAAADNRCRLTASSKFQASNDGESGFRQL